MKKLLSFFIILSFVNFVNAQSFCLKNAKGDCLKIDIVNNKKAIVSYEMAKDVINLIFVKIKTLQTSPHPIDSYYYNEIINKRITGLYVLTYSGNTISLTYKKATGKITYLYEGYRTESGDCDCRNL